MKTKKQMRLSTIVLVLVISLIMPTFTSVATELLMDDAAIGEIGAVILITGSEIEIEYNAPVLSNAEAQGIFTVLVSGQPVEWEFLSYFNFGPYATRGGVVNVRLKEALDAGRPREERRDSQRFANTQNTRGPAAAARISVVAGGVTKTASWQAFYEEVNQGHMHMMYSWAAAGAGNATANSFSATNQQYTTQYLARQMSEGTNSFIGRSEYLNIPGVRAGLSFYVLGGRQSVYEAPAWRELYVHGVTADTYTRKTLPGTPEKPYVITTADEVMRHNSVIDANGNLVSRDLPPDMLPQSDATVETG